MMKNKYNLLTEELLFSGYSEKNYPAYVKLPSDSSCKENPLDNFYGGFEYQRWYLEQQHYQTGCGLYVTVRNCITNMSYRGVEWCFENDNMLIRCPYFNKNCSQNDARLNEMGDGFIFCVCHFADHYEYEHSVEKIKKDLESDKEQRYEQYVEEHSGKICRNHMYYKEKEKKWEFHYDPMQCARVCSGSFCPMRSRMLTTEKGNVFYDVRVSTIRKDGTLFDGQQMISIIKGKKFLERQVSMDICRSIADHCKDDMFRREWWNGYSMRKLFDPDLKIEIINVRAERRVCRDLEQDLADIRKGILVVHESDQLKQKKEQKKERRKKRLERVQKKIEKIGYENLSGAEQRFADKKIGTDGIKDIEKKRLEKEQQISLSDWMDLQAKGKESEYG